MHKSKPSILKRGTAKLVRWQARISQKIMLPFASIPNPDRWIFIIGCYNSGTSLLAKILASHPKIAGMPDEGIYFTDRLPYPEQFGWPRMWIRCVDRMQLEAGTASQIASQRVKKQWSLSYTGCSENLLEKSVSNVARIPFLNEYFQPAYFISIVRNGYAVSEGIRRRVTPAKWGNAKFTDSYPIELCAEQWRECDEVISRESNELSRFMQITYEDLTEDPIAVTGRLTDFLGLERIDSERLRRDWFVNDMDKPIQNMNDQSLSRLSASDIVAIRETAFPILDKYGYEVPKQD